jgi:predicted PurR-regulated permease PerM
MLVFALILLILIIHTIEAYVLNPNIVSNFLELPVSLTFIILII